MDGIGRSVEELECVYSHSKSHCNALSAAFIDLRKAFNSMSFDAIYEALRLLGVPNHFISYIRFIYSHVRTFLIFDGNVFHSIHPTTRVRQGDSHSSNLFLFCWILLFDNFTSDLVRSYGYFVRISHIAYVDDILLLTRDTNCLQ